MVINRRNFFDFRATLVCKTSKIRYLVEFQDLEKNTVLPVFDKQIYENLLVKSFSLLFLD